jgi:putative phosphoesterase
MTIGLLSDTHGFLDPKVFHHFQSCDEIWHAGDVGNGNLLDQLEAFKPVRAVYGNIDGAALRTRLPLDWQFICEGVSVFMTHIGGAPPRYNTRVRKILQSTPPDLFICGHSHILSVRRDELIGRMLYVNPGAAGNHGFHRVKTLVRFTLSDGKISDLQVIEIGQRGALTP